MSEVLADRRIPAGDDYLSAEELAALTPEALIARTTALKPLVAEHAAEAEGLRRPVDAVWNAIRASGYFYTYVPRRFGGLEFDPDTYERDDPRARRVAARRAHVHLARRGRARD